MNNINWIDYPLNQKLKRSRRLTQLRPFQKRFIVSIFAILTVTALFSFVSTSFGDTTSAKYAGTGADAGNGQDCTWSNPTNAQGDTTSTAATCTVGGGSATTNTLILTNFGFTDSDIPVGSSIDGITVEVEWDSSLTDNTVQLTTNASTGTGDNKATSTAQGTKGFRTYGGSADDWTAGIDQTEATSTNFGVILNYTKGGGGGDDVSVYRVRMTIDYTPVPAFTQNEYRWYQNADNVQPGTALQTENTSATITSTEDPIRLRMNVTVSNANLSSSSQQFKLQHATDTGGPWTDVGTGAWTFYDNTTPTDGATISSTVLTSSDVQETYEEGNPTATNPNGINTGQDGEWDFALDPSSTAETTYYFRMVENDDTPLGTYTRYPTLTVDLPSTFEQSGYRWFENPTGSGGSDGGPTNIDNASDFGALPGAGRQVVRTSSGTLYAVINDGGSCEVWKSADGSSWAEQDSSNNPSCTSDEAVSVAIDSSSNLHIIYDTTGSSVEYITFSTSTDQFGSSENIFSGPGGLASVDPSIAIDSNDIPHVVISTNSCGGICPDVSWEVKYANRIDGSWTTVNIESDLSSPAQFTTTSISISEDNIPEISYINVPDNDLIAAVGDDNNPNVISQWTLQSVDTSVNATSGTSGTSIAVDSSGNTWVAYVDTTGTNQINLVKHNDGDAWSTWQTPVTNSNVGNEPSIAINGTDIYVFYEDSADDDIKYDMYNGSTWLGETTLQTGTFQDVKARWAMTNNNGSTGQDNSLYSYYFNDSTPSDPDSAWTSDANGFDGDSTNAASTTVSGSKTSNYLQGNGTNAPASGETITGVQVRHRATNGDFGNESVSATYFTQGGSEELGTTEAFGGILSGREFSDWLTLTVPTGGWTWDKVSNLEVRYWVDTIDSSAEVTIAEVIVQTSDSPTEIDYLYSDGTDVYWASVGIGTSPTAVGDPLEDLNTAITAPEQGTSFRLRALMHVAGGQLTQSEETFKLQYAQKQGAVCGGGDESFSDVLTGSGAIRYSDETEPSDGDTLTTNASDPTHSSDDIIAQTYEEANNFTNSVAAIPAGDDGMWDFSLIDFAASPATDYCFQIVQSDDTPLDTYSQYPELTTSGSPEAGAEIQTNFEGLTIQGLNIN